MRWAYWSIWTRASASAAVCLNTDSGQSDEMFYVGSVGDNLPNNCAIKWRLPDGQDWDSSSWTRVTFDSAGTSSPGPFEWHGAITNSSYNPLVYAIGSQHIASCPGAEQETVLCGGDTSYDWIYRADMIPDERAYFRWCHGLSQVRGKSKEVFIITTPTTEKGGPFVAVCPVAGGTANNSVENIQLRLLCEVLYSLDGVEWTVVHTGPVHPRAQAHILDDRIVITDDGNAHGGAGEQQRGLSTVILPTLTTSRRPIVCAPGGSIYARQASTSAGSTYWADWYLAGDGAAIPDRTTDTDDCPSPLVKNGMSNTANAVRVVCKHDGSVTFPDDLANLVVPFNYLTIETPAPTLTEFRARTWIKVLRADCQDLYSQIVVRDSSTPTNLQFLAPIFDTKWLVSRDRWFPADFAIEAPIDLDNTGPWGLIIKLGREGTLKWGEFYSVCEGPFRDSISPGRWSMPFNTQSLPLSAPDGTTTYNPETLTISGFTCGAQWVAFVAIQIPDDAFDESADGVPSTGFHDLFTLVESSTKYVSVRAFKGHVIGTGPYFQGKLEVRFVNGGTTATLTLTPVAWERGSPVLVRIQGGVGADENLSAAVNVGFLSTGVFLSNPPDVRPTTFVTGDQNGDMNAPVQVFGVEIWESAAGAPSAESAFGDLEFLDLS